MFAQQRFRALPGQLPVQHISWPNQALARGGRGPFLQKLWLALAWQMSLQDILLPTPGQKKQSFPCAFLASLQESLGRSYPAISPGPRVKPPAVTQSGVFQLGTSWWEKTTGRGHSLPTLSNPGEVQERRGMWGP